MTENCINDETKQKKNNNNNNHQSLVWSNSIWYPFYHSWVRAYFIVIANHTTEFAIEHWNWTGNQSHSWSSIPTNNKKKRITIEASNIFRKMITLSSTEREKNQQTIYRSYVWNWKLAISRNIVTCNITSISFHAIRPWSDSNNTTVIECTCRLYFVGLFHSVGTVVVVVVAGVIFIILMSEKRPKPWKLGSFPPISNKE